MRGEGQGAAASAIAGIGLPSLMWGFDRMGVEIPYGAAMAISIASALLILVSLALAGHLLWQKRLAIQKATIKYWGRRGKRHAFVLGVLLAGTAIGWLVGSYPYNFWRFPKNTGPIVWNFDETASGHGYFLDMQKTENQEINIIGFGGIGKNISSNPIDDFQGYLRSDMTNEIVPIYILAVDAGAAHACTFAAPTLPSDTLGIPAFSAVQIATHKNPFFMNVPYAGALPITKFEAEFVPFTVVLKYEGRGAIAESW
jgi:hypothetical protein